MHFNFSVCEFLMSYEQKYSTLNVVLYMKLKLLKNAIWCRNFKTLAKREIFKSTKRMPIICHFFAQWQLFLYF